MEDTLSGRWSQLVAATAGMILVEVEEAELRGLVGDLGNDCLIVIVSGM